MSDKVKRVLNIGGREISLMTSQDPVYLRRLQEFTNRRLNETAIAARVPVSAASVMCCLDLADELLKAQDEIRRVRIENEELRTQISGDKV